MDEPIVVEPPKPAIPAGRVDVRTSALSILAGASTVYVLREGAELLAPVLVSVLLAYALEPLVGLLTRCRLPRTLSVVGVYALLIAGVATAGRLAQHQVAGFIDTLPATVQELQDSIVRAREEAGPAGGANAIQHLQRAATDLAATIDASAPRPRPGVARIVPVNPPFNLRSHLAGASWRIAEVGARLFAIALLTFMLLLTGEALKRKLIAIAGPRAQKKLTHEVIKAIDRQIERYLVARALISAIVGAATWLGLWALGVRQALVLGALAGVLNLMPFVGPAASFALVAVVAFLQFHTIGMTAAACGVAGLVAALEGNLISPWLTSRAGELNTVAVFVSMLFWDGCGTRGAWCSRSRSWSRSRLQRITSIRCSLWENCSDGSHG